MNTNKMNTTMICPKDFIRYNKGNNVTNVFNVLDSNKEKIYTQIRYKKENLEKSDENGNYYSDYKSVITNKNDDVVSYAIPRSIEMELLWMKMTLQSVLLKNLWKELWCHYFMIKVRLNYMFQN